MKKAAIVASVAASIVFAILTACSTIQPGADPLVVRTEQTLSMADASFGLVLHVDDTDRAFWIKNAPAFHTFCEWLRTPTTYHDGTYPRCNVMLLDVNDLKASYKFNKTVSSSNALYTALLTLSSVADQATSWKTIVTAPTH